MEKLKICLKSFAILIAMMVWGVSAAYAQMAVKGVVTDTSGEPLIGASVVEKARKTP